MPALAAIMLQAGVVIAAGQERPTKLTVQAQHGKLHATTWLSPVYWKDGKGAATAKIQASANDEIFPPEDVVPAVDYQIKQQMLSANIPYHRPSLKRLTVTVQIMGIKQQNGHESVMEGNCVLESVPSVDGTSDGSTKTKTATPSPDVNVSENLPAATPVPSAAPEMTPPSPKEPPNAAADLALFGRMLAYGNAVALIVLGLFGWQLLSRKPLTAAKSDSPHPKKQQPVDDSTGESVRTIEHRLRQVEEAINNCPPPGPSNPILELLGKTGDFDRLIEIAVADTAPVSSSPTVFEAVDTGGTTGVDLRTASAVNGWLADRGRNRQELVQRARDLGLNSRLLSLRNLNEWKPESFEYAFEVNADGAWLSTPIAGSNEIWLAPADVSLLGMGKAPSILQTLFDGMENAGHGFRFEAIYAPCRLRPAPDKNGLYTLVKKGVLQLTGNPAPAGEVIPPRIRPSHGPRTSPAAKSWQRTNKSSTVSKTSPIAKLLADWMHTTSARLCEQSASLQKLLHAHQQLAESMSSSRPATDTDAVKKINEEMVAFHSNIAELRKEMGCLRNDVKTKLENVHWDIIRTGNKMRQELKAPAQVQTLPSISEPQFTAVDSTLVSDFTFEQASSVVTPEDYAVRDAAKEVLQSVPPVSKPAPAVSKPAPATEGSMPPVWEQSWREAAQDETSQPGFMDIPLPSLYTMRLLTLQQAFRSHQIATEVSVVHLVILRSAGEVFELHETASDDGRLVCKRCSTDSMWQFAVCIKVRPGSQMNILYPKGRYGKSNFPAGYELLIDNPPSPSFSIDEPSFAELHCKNQQTMTFEVRRTISCAKPLAATEGRP